MLNIPENAKWAQEGVTVAGGRKQGTTINQLCYPEGLFVDDHQTVFIADWGNHCIMQWKKDDTNGKIVAGGNGRGRRLYQLNRPIDVLIDKEKNSLIISDQGNRRVVRWLLVNDEAQGEILIENICCYGLAMDDQGYLYVSDIEAHEVRRYKLGANGFTLIAGGNGKGAGLNQLNYPTYLFVDPQQNFYVSDWNNHRVVKWIKDAEEGIVVAGGQGHGKGLAQLEYPNGLFVDASETLYVADWGNHRVVSWPQGAQQGIIIVGGNGRGINADQFHYPHDLFFDQHHNLYVTDYNNRRVQLFSLKIDS
ncbi:unnamed protein product [Rotaria socialis]